MKSTGKSTWTSTWKWQLDQEFKLKLCRCTVGRLPLLPMTSLASLASVVMPCAGPLLVYKFDRRLRRPFVITVYTHTLDLSHGHMCFANGFLQSHSINVLFRFIPGIGILLVMLFSFLLTSWGDYPLVSSNMACWKIPELNAITQTEYAGNIWTF